MISLVMPAFEAGTSDVGSLGFVLVLTGWFGIYEGEWSTIFWLANPILYVAWFLFKLKPVLALEIGGLAFAVALSFLCCDEIMISESGKHANISKYAIGYWTWMLSMAIFFFRNLYLYFKNKQSKLGQAKQRDIFE